MKSTPSKAVRYPPGLYSFDVEVLICLVKLLQRSVSDSEHRSSRPPLAAHCATVPFRRRLLEEHAGTANRRMPHRLRAVLPSENAVCLRLA